VALIMLDLDHFKAVNDTYGHPAGDRVLVALADALRQSMREVDVVGRLGGEEFAILMPDTSAEAATQAAERIRRAIEALVLDIDGQRLAFTASFGVAVFGRADDTIHDLFTRADRALYRAKQAGRNRVELFGDRHGAA
jgi:diguanylate cyclase (GGDEF)-like protein